MLNKISPTITSVLYFTLEPARAPDMIEAGTISKEGSVEIRRRVVKGISGNASAMFWIAGVRIPTPISTKKTDIIAMDDNVVLLFIFFYLLMHNVKSLGLR